MSSKVQIKLQPLGKTLDVFQGAFLKPLLFPLGVEFPCGGDGMCSGCRVKLLQGTAAVSPEDKTMLSPEEIEEGWRLACRLRAECDMTLEVAQWSGKALQDDTEMKGRTTKGIGVAVDLGSTTVVMQCIDLASGEILAVDSFLNPQAQYGSDIMSRIEYAVERGGHGTLVQSIHEPTGLALQNYEKEFCQQEVLSNIVLVGNSVMHHLFCDLDVTPLSHFPFELEPFEVKARRSNDYQWPLQNDSYVHFIPPVAGFVGSDVLAGIVAAKMYESEDLCALIDLGTNGEIVVGNKDGMLCASTAAGPAFEGARIGKGMRADTGAISGVTVEDGELQIRVIGDGEPRGICGSGLVDAAAAGLQLGIIHSNGRLADPGKRWMLAPKVYLTQCDIRELQLAKAAIAGGLKVLAEHWGAGLKNISQLYLAGAFGNYIDIGSAKRIGLIPDAIEDVVSVGNSALRGAKIALSDPQRFDETSDAIREVIEHVTLGNDAEFQEQYVAEMVFPHSKGYSKNP